MNQRTFFGWLTLGLTVLFFQACSTQQKATDEVVRFGNNAQFWESEAN